MAEPKRKEPDVVGKDLGPQSTADLAGRQRIEDDINDLEPDRPDPERTSTNEWGRPTLVATGAPHQGIPGKNESMPSAEKVSAQTENANEPLFSEGDVNDFRERWTSVQAEFVDDPRLAVAEADKLVASTMQRLAEGFSRERLALEKQWSLGENVSTEDLRLAIQRYRSFFDRLLHA